MVATILIHFMTMRAIALAAQPTSQSKPDADAVVAAWVLGEPIYQKDVMDEDPNMDRNMRGIPAGEPEERLRAYYAMRLFAKIIIPLRACYLESHSQQATPKELGAYLGEEYRHAALRRRRAALRLERIQQELERKDLKPQEIADLLRDEGQTKKFLKSSRHPRDRRAPFDDADFRRFMDYVDNWKLQRAVYDEYKAQEITPGDAMGRWLEAAEKAGEFTIIEPSLRAGFARLLLDMASNPKPLPARPPHEWEESASPRPIRFGNKSVPAEPLPPAPAPAFSAQLR